MIFDPLKEISRVFGLYEKARDGFTGYTVKVRNVSTHFCETYACEANVCTLRVYL